MIWLSKKKHTQDILMALGRSRKAASNQKRVLGLEGWAGVHQWEVRAAWQEAVSDSTLQLLGGKDQWE